MIEQAFAALPEVRVLLFEPAGAPDARQMPVRTKRPNHGGAGLVHSVDGSYAAQSYRLTLLEIQKLAYFLQEAGTAVEAELRGGALTGRMRQSNRFWRCLSVITRPVTGHTEPDVEIQLVEGAAQEAAAFLAN